MNPPKRRFTVKIQIGADSETEILSELNNIYTHFAFGRKDSVSGSPISNHMITVEENPGQTNERYHEQLKEYLRERDKDERKN